MKIRELQVGRMFYDLYPGKQLSIALRKSPYCGSCSKIDSCGTFVSLTADVISCKNKA